MTKHPSAKIGNGTSIGSYCDIGKYVVIGKNCKIGKYVEIRDYSVIGDNTIIGSRCTFSKNSRIGNNCVIKYGFVLTDTPDIKNNNFKSVGHIGNNVMIGANVTLMPGVCIDDNAIIGACSQVRHHVKKGETWYGNPAMRK